MSNFNFFSSGFALFAEGEGNVELNTIEGIKVGHVCLKILTISHVLKIKLQRQGATQALCLSPVVR